MTEEKQPKSQGQSRTSLSSFLKSELLPFMGCFVGYCILAKGGLLFATINSFASPFWPAGGFAIAAVLRFKHSAVLAVFCAAFVASFTDVSAIPGVLLIGLGNTLEALLGAKLLSSPFTLIKTQNNNKFMRIFLLSALAPAASALIGVSALLGVGIVSSELYARTLVTWWTGNSLGILLLFPALIQTLEVFEKSTAQARSEPFINNKVLCGLVIGLFYLACFVALAHFPKLGGAVFVIFIPLLFSGAFLAERGIHFTAIGASLVLVALDVLDHGPLSDLPRNDRLVGLQLFTFSIALTALALAHWRRSVPIRYFARELAVGWVITGTIFFLLHRNLAQDEQRRFSAMAADEAQFIEREFATFSELIKEKYLSSLLAQEETQRRFDSETVWTNFTASLAASRQFKPGETILSAQLLKHSDLQPGTAKVSPQEGRILFEKHWQSASSDSQRAQNTVSLDILFSPSDLVQTSSTALNSELEKLFVRFTLDAKFFLKKAPIQSDTDSGVAVSLLPIAAAAGQKNTKDPISSKFLGSILPFSSRNLNFEETIEFDDRAALVLALQKKRSAQSASDFSLAWSAGLGALLSLSIAQIVASSRSFQMRAEKLAESKTRLLEKQTLFLNGVLDSAPVAILQVSASGQIRFLNHMAHEFFAGSAKEIGKNKPPKSDKMTWSDLSLLLKPEEQEHCCSALETARAQATTVLFQGTLRNDSTGQEQVLQFRILALQPSPTAPDDLAEGQRPGTTADPTAAAAHDEKNKVPACIVLVLDVTREKVAQSELEAEQLRSIQSAKMATLGEMAGGIAHEINNPLAIVDLCAHQLEIMLESGTLQEEIIQRNTSKIRSTIQRIAAIVRGLKSFARDTSHDPLRYESPVLIINECIALCESRLRKQNITITAFVPEEIPLLPCLATQIMQVLLNLISNAADALENQNIRKINVGVEHSTKNSENFACFYVEDTGPGVPESLRSKIMNPFFTTKAVGKGTGLGLSISRSIAISHGGTLYLDTSSKHTRFVMEIPYAAHETIQTENHSSANLIDLRKQA